MKPKVGDLVRRSMRFDLYALILPTELAFYYSDRVFQGTSNIWRLQDINEQMEFYTDIFQEEEAINYEYTRLHPSQP